MIPGSLLRQATLLDRSESRPVLDADVRELMVAQRAGWQERLAAIRGPVASRQYFRELLGEPPAANQTQVAAAADTVLWDAATLTPLAANQVRASQVFKVTAFGVTTTAVTGSQTLIVTPRFGTAVGGTSLGASRTAFVNAAVKTNVPWFLEMWVHFRTIGSGGLATCGGVFTAETVVGTAATTNSAPVNFGTGSTTATTVNTTAAAGLVVSVTPSLATQTFTCLGVVMEALN